MNPENYTRAFIEEDDQSDLPSTDYPERFTRDGLGYKCKKCKTEIRRKTIYRSSLENIPPLSLRYSETLYNESDIKNGKFRNLIREDSPYCPKCDKE
jgi:hypothetical protein